MLGPEIIKLVVQNIRVCCRNKLSIVKFSFISLVTFHCSPFLNYDIIDTTRLMYTKTQIISFARNATDILTAASFKKLEVHLKIAHKSVIVVVNNN